MNRLAAFLRRLKASFTALPLPQKLLTAGSVLMVVASLAYLAYSVNSVSYAPLYTGLSEPDMAAVVESLKAKKLPYRLVDGQSIEVPEDQLYETRLALASEGLPKGSGVGFEIFDKQRLGSTEFVQKINYQRALQGELVRTINQMEEVEESRVHLVLPEDTVFVEDRQPPRAAVFLKLKPGARLEERQLQALVNLVASAVQGLESENVTIMSTDGQVFYKKTGEDTPFAANSFQMEYRNRLEESLRQKVQSMLEPVLGSDKVVTRVTAELDFSEVAVTEDIYDPDSAVVRSQQRSVENSEGTGVGARGNPDAPINLESRLLESATPENRQRSTSRQRETVNYEINRVSRQITRAPGSIKRLSVAVIVDGPYKVETVDGQGTRKVFVGRTQEELKRLEDLVKKAVGYDENRDDQITVSNVAFATEAFPDGAVSAQALNWLDLLRRHQKLIFNLLLLLLVLLFVIRPFMKRFQQMTVGGEQERRPALPGTAEEGLLEESQRKELGVKEQAIAIALENPHQAAQVIRTWLKEES
jgi:flagellar M-ring protein FliF